MKQATKHSVISQQLAEEIIAGKYGDSGRLPSEARLGQKYGVSRPTICRALRVLQERGLVRRKRGAGTFVHGEVNADEALPASGSQLGIIVPSLLDTEIFESICGQLASFARAHDFGFTWGFGSPRSRETKLTIPEAEKLCDNFIKLRVAGVFFVPFEHHEDRYDANQRIADKLRQAGIPLVLIDRDIVAFPSRSMFDVVEVNNTLGGYQLADHLLKLGARRLAFVTKPLTADTLHSRIAGVRMALTAHGLEAGQLVFTGDPSDTRFVRSLIHGAMPDAVICINDHTAAQFIQSAAKIGVRIPTDLKVVGFDDMRFASSLPVPLTTIRQPSGDIAMTAFNALKERITNPGLPARNLVVTPTLVIRESCGAYHRQKLPAGAGAGAT